MFSNCSLSMTRLSVTVADSAASPNAQAAARTSTSHSSANTMDDLPHAVTEPLIVAANHQDRLRTASEQDVDHGPGAVGADRLQ